MNHDVTEFKCLLYRVVGNEKCQQGYHWTMLFVKFRQDYFMLLSPLLCDNDLN